MACKLAVMSEIPIWLPAVGIQWDIITKYYPVRTEYMCLSILTLSYQMKLIAKCDAGAWTDVDLARIRHTFKI